MNISQQPALRGIASVISVIIAGRFNMEADKGEITLLLERVAEGDRAAEEALMPRVYVELHRLAMARLKSERPDHTLQPTALVNEVYLRMCRSAEFRCQDRAHFFRIAARLMRRILVDYARQRSAGKRNSGARVDMPEESLALCVSQPEQTLEIDQLLNQLARLSPRQAQVVEMRFYAGLSEEDIAVALGKHVRTIRRDWLVARAWLHQQLTQT